MSKEIKLMLSPELDYKRYKNDLNTCQSIYEDNLDYLLEKSGLSPKELSDTWSDFISDLIGDEWKLEDVNSVDDFLNMFFVYNGLEQR